MQIGGGNLIGEWSCLAESCIGHLELLFTFVFPRSVLCVPDPGLFLQVMSPVSKADPASACAFLAADSVGAMHRRTEWRGGGSEGGLSEVVFTLCRN